MSETLTDKINAEIERRLKTRLSEVDYFICLMALNDTQSQVRIAALEAEVRDLRATLLDVSGALLHAAELLRGAGYSTHSASFRMSANKARAALNR